MFLNVEDILSIRMSRANRMNQKSTLDRPFSGVKKWSLHLFDDHDSRQNGCCYFHIIPY